MTQIKKKNKTNSIIKYRTLFWGKNALKFLVVVPGIGPRERVDRPEGSTYRPRDGGTVLTSSPVRFI